MFKQRAFTLIELLISVAIIGLLVAILMPALASARDKALTLKCLANFRGMETAHWMYMQEYRGRFIDVGLAHGGAHAKEDIAWINTLAKYYGKALMHRSPVDDSPHWPVDEGGLGVPIPGSGGTQFRRTSYGVNNYLTSVAPFEPYERLTDVRHPSATVHFLYMAEEGQYAGADHPHVENWGADAFSPIRAANQMEIAAHGGPEKSFDSLTNYGFLDGHAETRKFRDVYLNFEINSFDPKVAQ